MGAKMTHRLRMESLARAVTRAASLTPDITVTQHNFLGKLNIFA